MVRARIELPYSSPQFRRGLLAAGRSLADLVEDGEWWRGVTFSSTGCVGPQLMGPCEDEFTTLGPQVPDEIGEILTFDPVSVRQGVSCTALSNTDITTISEGRLDVTREWAIGHVLETGNHTTHVVPDGFGGTLEVENPSLEASATTVIPNLSIGNAAGAVSCLEQAAANNLFGAATIIHAPPQIATRLHHENLIEREGRRWITAAGSEVIVSPGYQGTSIYATGEVFVAAGQRDTISNVDRSNNEKAAWSEDLVMVVFDPCWVGRVTFTDVGCT